MPQYSVSKQIKLLIREQPIQRTAVAGPRMNCAGRYYSSISSSSRLKSLIVELRFSIASALSSFACSSWPSLVACAFSFSVSNIASASSLLLPNICEAKTSVFDRVKLELFADKVVDVKVFSYRRLQQLACLLREPFICERRRHNALQRKNETVAVIHFRVMSDFVQHRCHHRTGNELHQLRPYQILPR